MFYKFYFLTLATHHALVLHLLKHVYMPVDTFHIFVRSVDPCSQSKILWILVIFSPYYFKQTDCCTHIGN